MFKATIVALPANKTELLANILGGLDPNESAKVTFKSCPNLTEDGVYVVEFPTEQVFDEFNIVPDDVRLLEKWTGQVIR